MAHNASVRSVPFSAGIIAAGDGLRLQSAYPGTPKPLVPIAGRPLIDWTVSSLSAAGAKELIVLLNSKGRSVREHLRARFPQMRWIFLEADTRSSWESFRIVAGALAERSERFLISTVDALISPDEVARFAFESKGVSLALTDFIEDEKPLWADVDSENRVTAMGPDAIKKSLVTCGLYAVTRDLARTSPAADSFSGLRDFWVSTVRSGVPVRGVTLAKTVDVDRPEDVPTAEAFVVSLEARAC